MEFTGERFVPELEIDSEISVFHRQRYKSVLKLCEGKVVLDAACGEGYGTAMLAEYASFVTGIDISEKAIDNAKYKYGNEKIKFMVSSVTSLPIESHTVDVVISFETIEHISKEEQMEFFKEIKRVLKEDGILVMSSPDKKNYSDIPNFHNKFHVHELYFDEFKKLIQRFFEKSKYYYQGMFCNSYIYDVEKGSSRIVETINISNKKEKSRSEYIIAICCEKEILDDIASVVYDETNVYYKMKDEALMLKERLGEPGKIIEQKENYICEQRERIQQLESESLASNAIIEQKENYICEQRERIQQLESKDLENTFIIEQKENYICEQRKRLQKLEDVLNKKFIGRIFRKILGE